MDPDDITILKALPSRIAVEISYPPENELGAGNRGEPTDEREPGIGRTDSLRSATCTPGRVIRIVMPQRSELLVTPIHAGTILLVILAAIGCDSHSQPNPSTITTDDSQPTQNMLIESQHPSSHRFAIFEDDGTSACCISRTPTVKNRSLMRGSTIASPPLRPKTYRHIAMGRLLPRSATPQILPFKCLHICTNGQANGRVMVNRSHS